MKSNTNKEQDMRAISLAIFGLLSSFSVGAHAAEAPELTGTWSGSGSSVSNSEGWETGRSASITITEQRGPVFKGVIKYESGEEEFVGVIKADGKTILMSSDDGIANATLISPNEIEDCYVEGGDDAMATCTIMKRAD